METLIARRVGSLVGDPSLERGGGIPPNGMRKRLLSRGRNDHLASIFFVLGDIFATVFFLCDASSSHPGTASLTRQTRAKKVDLPSCSFQNYI